MLGDERGKTGEFALLRENGLLKKSHPLATVNQYKSQIRRPGGGRKRPCKKRGDLWFEYYEENLGVKVLQEKGDLRSRGWEKVLGGDCRK